MYQFIYFISFFVAWNQHNKVRDAQNFKKALSNFHIMFSILSIY